MNRDYMSSALHGVAVAMLLACLMPAAAQSLEWRHVQGGKYGGAVFVNTEKGFLSADAHFRYTLNGGDDWLEATIPDAALYEEIRVDLRGMFLVQDPNSDFIDIWAVGDGGVVLKSTDGDGQVWSYLNKPSPGFPDPVDNRMFDALGAPARLYDIFMFSDTFYEEGIAAG